MSIRAMARILGRSPATVSRELTRNYPTDPTQQVSHATIYTAI
jgi:IS30 family transposase